MIIEVISGKVVLKIPKGEKKKAQINSTNKINTTGVNSSNENL